MVSERRGLDVLADVARSAEEDPKLSRSWGCVLTKGQPYKFNAHIKSEGSSLSIFLWQIPITTTQLQQR